MARLPTVGGDSGNWGTILNEYLGTAHNTDGTLKLDVKTIADLKAVDVATLTDKQQALVAGYSAPGDGGGGQFYYDVAASDADNGGTVIAPTAGIGRWKRVYSGAINVRWFGAKGDDDGAGGGTDDTAAFTSAISASSLVFVPAGVYKITNTLSLTSGKKLVSSEDATVALSGSGSIVMTQLEASLKGLIIRALPGYSGTAVTIAGETGSTISTKIQNCSFVGLDVTGTAVLISSTVASKPVIFFNITDCSFKGWQYGIRIVASVASGSVYCNGGNASNLLFWGNYSYGIHMSTSGAGATECSGNNFTNIQMQTAVSVQKAITLTGGKCHHNSVANLMLWDVSLSANQPLITVDAGCYANYFEGCFGEDGVNYSIDPAGNTVFARVFQYATAATLKLANRTVAVGAATIGRISDVTVGATTYDVTTKEMVKFVNTAPVAFTNFITPLSGASVGRRLLVLGDGQTTITPTENATLGKIWGSPFLLANYVMYEFVYMSGYWFRLT